MQAPRQNLSRQPRHAQRIIGGRSSRVVRVQAVNTEQLAIAKVKCEELCLKVQCQPIMVRLGA